MVQWCCAWLAVLLATTGAVEALRWRRNRLGRTSLSCSRTVCVCARAHTQVHVVAPARCWFSVVGRTPRGHVMLQGRGPVHVVSGGDIEAACGVHGGASRLRCAADTVRPRGHAAAERWSSVLAAARQSALRSCCRRPRAWQDFPLCFQGDWRSASASADEHRGPPSPRVPAARATRDRGRVAVTMAACPGAARPPGSTSYTTGTPDPR